MKNLDAIKQKKIEFAQKLQAAVNGGEPEQLAEAITAFADDLQDSILQEARELTQRNDSVILSQRGCRQLTDAEQRFYEATISAMRSTDPKQAISNIEVAMPETVIDSVFDDIREEHPLLGLIDFRNTMGKIKMVVNKTGVQLAAWGALTEEITKEISAAIGIIDTGLMKLTAFLPVSKAMLDLGPAWLDRYVREILSEVIAASLETAIVCGDGKNQPIGMIRSVSDDVSVTGGVYPEKEAIPVKDLKPSTYGGLLSKIADGPNGKIRKISNLILVVNPKDYFNKLMAWTTFRKNDGTYVNDILPYPTVIVPVTALPEGKAVLGLSKRYFAALGSTKDGKIEYDDSVRFLEDERVYAVRLYGNGQPLDDKAFLVLDISGLKAPVKEVKVVDGAAE